MQQCETTKFLNSRLLSGAGQTTPGGVWTEVGSRQSLNLVKNISWQVHAERAEAS